MSLQWNATAQSVLNNLQQKQHKRKSYFNPYKKRFQPITRTKRSILPNKLQIHPSAKSSWVGDVMNKNPSRGHVRFWLQNCNGLKPKDNSNINHTFTQLHEYGIHYCSLTETNVNASNPQSI